MFDYVRSSYNLGEFTNVTCQTKDIEDGIGGTMNTYWIDPKGVLWYPNYAGTSNFEIIEEDDPEYNPELKFLNYKWVPTGEHGKIMYHPITKYVEIYPEQWDGEWEDWPRCVIHFVRGVVQGYEVISKYQSIQRKK